MAIWRGAVQIAQPDINGVGVNTWHFRTPGEPPTPLSFLNDLMEAVHQFYDDISDLFPSDTTISFSGDFLEVATETPTAVSGDDWSVAGTTSVQPLPPANALVAAWGTSLASRSGRGRTFLSPITMDAVQDNGTPKEEVRDMIVTAGNTLISTFDDPGDGAVGVYSPKDGVIRDLTSVKVANRFSVLTSRRD